MQLLPELLLHSAERQPDAPALWHGAAMTPYGALAQQAVALAGSFMALGLARGDRVAVCLDKSPELVLSCFAASLAGCVFVPINPVLKPAQVQHIVADAGAALLITQAVRWRKLQEAMDELNPGGPPLPQGLGVICVDAESPAGAPSWAEALRSPARPGHRVLDTDLTAILYTSGSTGRPKGVMLSHRNMVVGALSVASYLGNHADDRLLGVLPLSFDAGFSQLTTAFSVGASVALLTPLLPRDVLAAMARHRITGLTAVPPLYIQLAALDWPEAAGAHLRYFANTGGRMPQDTLQALRAKLPRAQPFLMYGLTEAFRSTYLPPAEVDRRPDSIGQAIPGAEVLVLRDDGSPCAPDEPGELVHRGPLVAQGYWGDAERTAERFKPLPAAAGGRLPGHTLPEHAVFSGDTVRRDAEGFLYFVGRRDEMIKTSGYRVSPTEVEEAVYATRLVGECAAFGVPHPQLGQSILLVASAAAGQSGVDVDALLAACRRELPAFMVPAQVRVWPTGLPRNANGKIDRQALVRAGFEPASADAPAAPSPTA
jgi:acyl-CoA ligase (AMP-forming) (exosortase A-associated)